MLGITFYILAFALMARGAIIFLEARKDPLEQQSLLPGRLMFLAGPVLVAATQFTFGTDCLKILGSSIAGSWRAAGLGFLLAIGYTFLRKWLRGRLNNN